MNDTKPDPPPGLAERGRDFWVTTLDAYELTDSELAILTEVCRTIDNLDSLTESITKAGPMATGSMGQQVVNPALTEARGQRAILHRLLAALALPDIEGEALPTARSTAAQTANAARWRGHVKEGA